ncbi:hypothetical protein HMPREF9370_1897 [Neisseria wadsworthii 9715]|uniref:Uncharacterized protein n=1 Tax=Neisseria wadsworthii 9715 TaxID=1030841 RepID=G4CS37_9NEIS|nr:hypothetical protein HMPREF9370_1897 [Neisseria wadsworthii 9715]
MNHKNNTKLKNIRLFFKIFGYLKSDTNCHIKQKANSINCNKKYNHMIYIKLFISIFTK